MKGVVMDDQQRIEDLEAIPARGRPVQMGAHTSRVHSKRRQHIANMYGARVGGHADPVLQITTVLQMRVEEAEPIEDIPMEEDRGRLSEEIRADSSHGHLCDLLRRTSVRDSIGG